MGRRRGPADAMPVLELAAPLNFYEAEAGWVWSAEQQGWDGQARWGQPELAHVAVRVCGVRLFITPQTGGLERYRAHVPSHGRDVHKVGTYLLKHLSYKIECI